MSSTNTTATDTIEHSVILFLNSWVLVPQIAFGCTGNVLNLVVLLNRAMRSRTNIIFAAMALSDLIFFLLLIVDFVFYHGPLRSVEAFRRHHYILTSLTNWFSASSIWLMTYATLERVQVISCPFRSSSRTVNTRFLVTLLAIFLAGLLVTGVHFVRGWAMVYQVTSLTKIIEYLTYINVLLVVLGPLAICSLLNWRLVKALKSNNRSWTTLDDTQVHNQAVYHTRARVERKITIVMCAIITCFVICNVPSALLFLFREFYPQIASGLRFTMIRTMSNTLATFGKTLNFVLFCLTSEHFRKLLRERWECGRARFMPHRRGSWRSQKTTSFPLEVM